MMRIRRIDVSTSSRGRLNTLVAGLVLSAIALSGCTVGTGGSPSGGGNASGGATGGGGGGSSKLVFRATGPTFTDMTTEVLAAQNLLQKVGLDADFQFIAASNAATATQILIAGQADVISTGTGSLFSAYQQGKTDLVSLGTVNPSVTFGLAVNNDTAQKMAAAGVTPDSPVEQRVQALKGMQLAASPAGSTGQKYLRIMLSTYGVNPDKDVTIVPNADNAAQVAATKEGRTNGFANSFPNTNLPTAQGWGVLWLNWSKDLPAILPLAAQDYVTTRTWVKNNPDTAKKLMQAVVLAQQALQNPTADVKKSVQGLSGVKDLDPKAFDAGWDLSLPAYKDASPVTTQAMFDHQLQLINYGATTPFTAKLDDLYDLSAAKAAKP